MSHLSPERASNLELLAWAFTVALATAACIYCAHQIESTGGTLAAIGLIAALGALACLAASCWVAPVVECADCMDTQGRDCQCRMGNDYRVWPDGTVQDCGEDPYTWMSDDYAIVRAKTEVDALERAQRHGYA